MNDTNPYSAPQTDVSTNVAVSSRLQDLDFKRLKKLYHRSCNVNAIAFLLGLGILILSGISIIPDALEEKSAKYIFIGLIVFYAITLFGLYQRTSWGRILGIIVCIISLINLPLGTLIGIVGLFAFFGAPELFGANRITHRELKFEFKLQKANLKNQKNAPPEA